MKHDSKAERAALLAIIACGAFASIGAIWDTIWWHRYIGRDSFWIPPHTCVVIGTTIGLFIALYFWFINRKSIWRAFALCFLLVISAQPVDNLWHSLFGIEDPLTIWIFWSPPHLFIVSTIVFFWFVVLKTSRTFPLGLLRDVLLGMGWAFILSALTLETRPLLPVGSVYELMGFWGAGVIAMSLTFLLVLAKHIDGTRHICVRIVALYYGIHAIIGLFAIWMFMLVSSAPVSVLWRVFAGGASNVPGWIQMITFFSVAAWIDLSVKVHVVLRSCIAGLLYGVGMFSYSSFFLDDGDQFGLIQSLQAITASVIGGVIIGMLIMFLLRFNILNHETRVSHH